jgi:hypothetical protein
VLRNLQDLRKVFDALTPQEEAQVLRCVVREIIAYPDKQILNIFELAELSPGSQKHIGWLCNQYPSRTLQFELSRIARPTV